MNYMDKLDIKIKNYFDVLEPEFPSWLLDYICTPELLHQRHISITCGTLYTDLFDTDFFFSSLDHSVAVALIIWHFTNDKKQTLSGLFHDIATPVFKHSIDFLNGDYMTQESTEDLTKYIIENSKDIMKLLNRDGIKLEEVCDYHIYPIADNDTPKLSSDRLEYSLSNALITYNLLNLEDIKEIYKDIEIQTDENGIIELGFKTEQIMLKFVEITSKLSIIYREDRTRYSMQFLADIIKELNKEKLIFKEDLYKYTEEEIIKLIKNSDYSNIFNKWSTSKKIKVSTTEPTGVYYVHHPAKIRYIDPLLNNKRASIINDKVKVLIQNNLSYDMNNYVYLDFNFERNNLNEKK